MASAERIAYQSWQKLATAEVTFLHQKSGLKWITDGDENTGYFHKSVVMRNAFTGIKRLRLEDGSTTTDKLVIKNACVDFYTSLFGTSNPTPCLQACIESIHPFRCTEAQRECLERPFTPAEIKAEFFALPRDKIPGPDGYTGEFFRHCWGIVGEEVTAAVLNFFTHGKMEPSWNSTAVSMIAKVSNAETVGDYRPISCLNSVYKVISKLLARRLQILLPDMIQENQTAFIKDRQIVENVLLASELVQGYNSVGTSKRGMLKIDLRKAFDSIEWSFILDILIATNFPSKYILWISQCIKTTRFSISVNSELCGYFKGKKGLRQGDPLSPYLFVLGMDIFSRLLDLRFLSGQIGFHPKATNPNVTHLIFADDVMLFFDGERNSLQAIVNLLAYFTNISGLVMNRSKTELFLAGTSAADQTLLSTMFGFSLAFILPVKCIKDIEKLCRKFLWSGASDIPKQAKVSWRKVCSPKEEGGLGLKDLRVWNKIFGLKLIWKLFTASGSLWVAWCKNHKLRRKCFWRLPSSSQGSSMWKQLLKLRYLAKTFLSCKIGDGRSCSFWYDKWTPFGDLFTFLGPREHLRLGLPLDSTMANARTIDGWIFRGARNLNEELLFSHLVESDFNTDAKDTYLWASPNGDPQDRFTFTETWNLIRPHAQEVNWHKQVWFTGSIPKHSFIMWLCCLDRLPTLSRLRNWGLVEDDTCHLCEIYFETRDHLFLRCPYSYDLWRWCLARLQFHYTGFNTWDRFLLWLKSPTSEAQMGPLKLIAAHAVIYAIWHERNASIFTGMRTPVEGLFHQLDRCIRNTCL
ncbi:PREDICTED: uncharacterized protein LOC104772751 [Camelina sativa]|uniref:Uncharacterized protein LOC104772751 n=1 Tax=Camelina sativa TaxID=90675 RepID=A0ABM0Y528_CAMSA|nr:PREDICTED: uncharacterized protein LOC104772751 [Camelina sativa]